MGAGTEVRTSQWGGALGIALGIALMLVSPVAVVGAQSEVAADGGRDAEARGLFEAGVAAFEAGRFADALLRWKESHALSGRPALHYNIGLALDRLRRDDEALEAFRAYLTWDAKGERAAEVQGRIRAIEEAMAARQGGTSEPGSPTEGAVVASPAQAAATLAGEGAPAPSGASSAGTSLTRQWWFWPAVGVVVAGVVVGVVAAASGPEAQLERPLVQEQGQVNFMALIRSREGAR